MADTRLFFIGRRPLLELCHELPGYSVVRGHGPGDDQLDHQWAHPGGHVRVRRQQVRRVVRVRPEVVGGVGSREYGANVQRQVSYLATVGREKLETKSITSDLAA